MKEFLQILHSWKWVVFYCTVLLPWITDVKLLAVYSRMLCIFVYFDFGLFFPICTSFSCIGVREWNDCCV